MRSHSSKHFKRKPTMRIRRWAKYADLLLVAIFVPAFFGQPLTEAAESQARTKIRIATASPSLS
jgi:hypothetical protein